MEFKYINEQEVEEKLTKDRARVAIQMIYFAKFAGQEPHANWIAEWDRLSGVLTQQEIDGFVADVERTVMTEKEKAVIKARVEGKDTTQYIAECEAIATAVEVVKADNEIVKLVAKDIQPVEKLID